MVVMQVFSTKPHAVEALASARFCAIRQFNRALARTTMQNSLISAPNISLGMLGYLIVCDSSCSRSTPGAFATSKTMFLSVLFDSDEVPKIIMLLFFSSSQHSRLHRNPRSIPVTVSAKSDLDSTPYLSSLSF